jgi:hypothetical protein
MNSCRKCRRQREQHREPAEVVEEAVGRYLASLRLERFADR